MSLENEKKRDSAIFAVRVCSDDTYVCFVVHNSRLQGPQPTTDVFGLINNDIADWLHSKG